MPCFTVTVSLTKTKTDRKTLKTQTVEKVRQLVDEFSNLFVLSFDGLRSAPIKSLRRQWPDSRFVIGKNSVLTVALGHSDSDEFRDGLHRVAQHLVGEVALLFTNRSEEEIVKCVRCTVSGLGVQRRMVPPLCVALFV